jgi:hypothetical protein
MSNLRIIFDNVADRTSSLTASTTSGSLVAANLKNDYKSQHHRSTGTTVAYTLNWSSAVTIGGIVLPATNLSATATIAVSFTGGTGSNISTMLACPDTSLTAWSNFTSTPNANLFAYGGLSKTAVWLATQRTDVTAMTITLTDTSNTAGYIDCSRIVCGPYWQPTYTVDRRGLNLLITDSSKTSRTDSGDLLTEQGFVTDELSFNLGVLTDADRNTLLDNFRRYGTSKSIAVSVFPPSTTSATSVSKAEQLFTIYGKRDNTDVEYLFPGYSSTQMKITGW